MKTKLNALLLGLLAISMVGCGGSESGVAVNSVPSYSEQGTVEEVSNSASLSWIAPVARTDGEALSMTDIGGYRVYAGSSPEELNLVAEISDPYKKPKKAFLDAFEKINNACDKWCKKLC